MRRPRAGMLLATSQRCSMVGGLVLLVAAAATTWATTFPADSYAASRQVCNANPLVYGTSLSAYRKYTYGPGAPDGGNSPENTQSPMGLVSQYPRALQESLASLESLSAAFSAYVPSFQSLLQLNPEEEILPPPEEWWEDLQSKSAAAAVEKGRVGGASRGGKKKQTMEGTTGRGRKTERRKVATTEAEHTDDAEDPPAPAPDTKEISKPLKGRFNFASFDCAASILASNPEAYKPTSILLDSKDQYMRNPCNAPEHYVVVELCDHGILIDTIVLGNFEMFSSTFKYVVISASDQYPPRKKDDGTEAWVELGQFMARNSRMAQVFHISKPKIWAKYLKISMLKHYGNEAECSVSVLRVFGTTMMEDFKRKEHSRMVRKKMQEAGPAEFQDPARESPLGIGDAPLDKGEPSSSPNLEHKPRDSQTESGSKAPRFPMTMTKLPDVSLIQPPATGPLDGETRSPFRTAIPLVPSPKASASKSHHSNRGSENTEKDGHMPIASGVSQENDSGSPLDTDARESTHDRGTPGDGQCRPFEQVFGRQPSSKPIWEREWAHHHHEDEPGSGDKKEKQETKDNDPGDDPDHTGTEDSVFTSLMRRLEHVEDQVMITTGYLNAQSTVLKKVIQTMDKKQKQQLLYVISHIQKEISGRIFDILSQHHVLRSETQRFRSRMGGSVQELARQIKNLSDEMQQRVLWERFQLVGLLVLIMVGVVRILLQRSVLGGGNGATQRANAVASTERTLWSGNWSWYELSPSNGEVLIKNTDDVVLSGEYTTTPGWEDENRHSGLAPFSSPPLSRARSPSTIRKGSTPVFFVRGDGPVIRRRQSESSLRRQPSSPPPNQSHSNSTTPVGTPRGFSPLRLSRLPTIGSSYRKAPRSPT